MKRDMEQKPGKTHPYMLFGMASDDNSQDHDKSNRNNVPHLHALKQSMEHSPFPVTSHGSNSRTLGILAHLEQRRGEGKKTR